MDLLDLNINHLRAAMTLLAFVAFGGIVVWAFSKRNQPQFDEAAMLPFLAESDDVPLKMHGPFDKAFSPEPRRRVRANGEGFATPNPFGLSLSKPARAGHEEI